MTKTSSSTQSRTGKNVYLPNGSSIWYYRFNINNKTHSGSTGTRNKSKAESIAKSEKVRLRSQSTTKTFTNSKSLLEAIDEYLSKQECSLSQPDNYLNQKTYEAEIRAFKFMLDVVGKDFPLDQLTTDKVAEIVNAKISVGKLNGMGKPVLENGRQKRLSGAYVNRYTWKLLRRVHIRERKRQILPDIDWNDPRIRQKEANPRTRELKYHEENAIRNDLKVMESEGYNDCFQVYLLSGFRKSELTDLKWSEVDFIEREIKRTVKTGKEHVIPICDEMFSILQKLNGNHPTYVFTYVAARNHKSAKRVKGNRYPVTQSGFTSWFKRYISEHAQGLTIHDLRRTRGGRMLRSTGNIRAVQKQLGHSDISTTAKHYAHIPPNEMLSLANQTNEMNKQKLDQTVSLIPRNSGK